MRQPNAEYVRTGRLFAMTPDQADEVILILTKELDPRGRRPCGLCLNAGNLAAGQQERAENAIAPHTRRRIDIVDHSKPDTKSATTDHPAPPQLGL